MAGNLADKPVQDTPDQHGDPAQGPRPGRRGQERADQAVPWRRKLAAPTPMDRVDMVVPSG